MLLEVCGQYGLDDKEAESLEFHVIEVGQKVVLGLGQVEVPGRRSVVVLQNRAVIIENSLGGEGGGGRQKNNNADSKTLSEKKNGSMYLSYTMCQ